ncbi:MOSC domain-containing protein [Lewinella sp. LCG006]|uniref:MOSC domain-containing protein n=1 Tax=Lewinella sp. LCG006 TaxID=3231911 RepID=UPI0034611ED4
MKIKELWVYPVKSLAGNAVASATLAARGFVDDRRWMLIDENGRFISQREHAHLARWHAHTEADDLLLEQLDTGQQLRISAARAEEGPLVQVQVWDDQFAARLVETLTQEELSTALGIPCRLVYMPDDANRPLDPRYAQGEEYISFADGYPYLVANQASLDALSAEVGEELSMQRFRPNIVLEGAPAFEEDEWQALQMGGETFRLPKPCARCVVITIDPATMAKNPRIFATLAQMHSQEKKVLFGMNACWEGKGVGELVVGEEVVPL